MIEQITDLSASGGVMQKQISKPAASDIENFQSLVGSANPPAEALKTFVEAAQENLQQSGRVIDKKLREFDTKNNIMELINAMHESAMKSVSVQLTSKIGTKVSENFEQLIKQQ